MNTWVQTKYNFRADILSIITVDRSNEFQSNKILDSTVDNDMCHNVGMVLRLATKKCRYFGTASMQFEAII